MASTTVADLAQHLSGHLEAEKTTAKQPGALCLSLYQTTLRNGWIQAEFHPLDHSLLVLFEAGELKCFSLSGRELWCVSLPWKPLVFRMHIDGNLVAIRGEGVLAFLDMQTSKMITVPVEGVIAPFPTQP